jgi:hypothetical protein
MNFSALLEVLSAMHTVQHLLLQIGDGSWQDVTLSRTRGGGA